MAGEEKSNADFVLVWGTNYWSVPYGTGYHQGAPGRPGLTTSWRRLLVRMWDVLDSDECRVFLDLGGSHEEAGKRIDDS